MLILSTFSSTPSLFYSIAFFFLASFLSDNCSFFLTFNAAGVAGAEVAGAEVAGAEVTDAEVTDAEVAGAEVAGAEVTGASRAGAGVAGLTRPKSWLEVLLRLPLQLELEESPLLPWLELEVLLLLLPLLELVVLRK